MPYDDSWGYYGHPRYGPPQESQGLGLRVWDFWDYGCGRGLVRHDSRVGFIEGIHGSPMNQQLDRRRNKKRQGRVQPP